MTGSRGTLAAQARSAGRGCPTDSLCDPGRGLSISGPSLLACELKEAGPCLSWVEKSLHEIQIQWLFILICPLCTKRGETEGQRDEVTLLKVMRLVCGGTETRTWLCLSPGPIFWYTWARWTRSADVLVLWLWGGSSQWKAPAGTGPRQNVTNVVTSSALFAGVTVGWL